MLNALAILVEGSKRYRIYYLLVFVFAVMAIAAPKFLTADTQISLLKQTSIHILPAVGFTFVLAIGQLDLSFATIMTFAGMLTMALQPKHGWVVAILVAIGMGLAIGWVNGLLVSKAKVNSFIVTLSTLTISQGVINIYCHGTTLNVDDLSLYQFLEKPSFLAPPIVFTLVMALVFEWILHRTTFGKNLLLTGGSPTTAWHSGIKTSRLVTIAFVLSGFLAALGGVLGSAVNASATPTMGNESLMIVIAAVIVGGTSMQGGKGTVFGSVAAVFMLCAISSGLSLLKFGQETTLIVNGLVLATLVLFEAFALKKRNLLKGQRLDLLEEMTTRRRDKSKPQIHKES